MKLYQVRVTQQQMGDGHNFTEITTVVTLSKDRFIPWFRAEVQGYCKMQGLKVMRTPVGLKDVHAETMLYRWLAVDKESVHRVIVITAEVREVNSI